MVPLYSRPDDSGLDRGGNVQARRGNEALEQHQRQFSPNNQRESSQSLRQLRSPAKAVISHRSNLHKQGIRLRALPGRNDDLLQTAAAGPGPDLPQIHAKGAQQPQLTLKRGESAEGSRGADRVAEQAHKGADQLFLCLVPAVLG